MYDLIQVTPETHAKMVDVEMINHFAPVKVEKFCLVIESKNLNDRKKWSNNIDWKTLNTKYISYKNGLPILVEEKQGNYWKKEIGNMEITVN